MTGRHRAPDAPTGPGRRPAAGGPAASGPLWASSAVNGRITHNDPPRAMSAPVSSVTVTSARATGGAGRAGFSTVAVVTSVPPGRAGRIWRRASSEVVIAVPAGRSSMIAHAMAASAGIASTPSGTRPSSARSHGDTGIANSAQPGLNRTGRMPVSRDSGGAGVSPASMADRKSTPGPVAR